MKRSIAPAAMLGAVALLGGLTACNSDSGTSESSTAAGTTTVSSAEKSAAGTATATTTDAPSSGDTSSNAEKETSQAYRAILEDPSSIDFHSPEGDRTPTGDYSYTLHDVDGDGHVELLLRSATKSGDSELGYVATIYPTTLHGDVKQADGLVADGEQAPGKKSELLVGKDGSPTLMEHTIDGSGEQAFKVWVLFNGELTSDSGQDSTDGYCRPTWLPTSDTSAVDELKPLPCAE